MLSVVLARLKSAPATAHLVLGLLLIAPLTGAAVAQTYPPGEPQIFLSPSNPTTNDTISFTIRGTHPDSCVPEFDSQGTTGSSGLSGSVVRIYLVEPPAGTNCFFAFTDYEIGPLQLSNPIPAGQYEVRLFNGGFPFGDPKSFTVTPAGGGGANPEITISPSNPTTNDVISITIRGTHPDSCVPEFDSGNAGNFDVNIFLTTRPGPCNFAQTQYEIGPLTTGPLPAGQHTVRLSLDGSPFGQPKAFTVSSAAGACQDDLSNGVVCLRNGRFELTMTSTDFNNQTAPVIFKKDSDEVALGVFSVNPNDVTLVAKVTNGCPLNGNYWVWLGAFTAAQLDLTVRDTVTGQTETYGKGLGGLMTTIKDDFSFPCN